MPPTYTWCPFYLRPCPSDILSPPLTCTLMSTLNHISKFPSKSQAAGFIIKWLCCWSKRPNLHSGDKEVSQLQSTCRGSRPGPGLVLPGWKVAVSSEVGRDRGEHERAEWKCTRGHMRPTWTPANGCTFWWRQLPQSSNGRVYSINSLRVGKFRGEKKKEVVKRVWTGGDSRCLLRVSSRDRGGHLSDSTRGKSSVGWDNEDVVIFFGWIELGNFSSPGTNTLG